MRWDGLPFEWPLAVIDFEATGLSAGSYPIEVGVAIAIEPALPPKCWSTLIKPATSWDIDAQWDPDAERVHKIRRWHLRDGMSPGDAMRALNGLIPSGGSVWCDGGHYDVHWLRTLSEAANVQPTFELRHLGDAFKLDEAFHKRYLDALGHTSPPHRAGQDALRICEALCSAGKM